MNHLFGTTQLIDPVLPVVSSEEAISSSANWNSEKGSLTLLCTSKLAGSSMVVALLNGNIAQPSPAVSIKSGVVRQDGVFATAGEWQEMTKPGVDLMGVPNGMDPLLIQVPSFLIMSMSQSNPLRLASNKIWLILESNVEMIPGTRVTISGLTGTDTSDDQALLAICTDCPQEQALNGSASWNQQSGTLMINVRPDAAQPYLRAFEVFDIAVVLQNGPTPQKSPEISIKMSVGSPDTANSEGQWQSIVKPNADLLGVPLGKDPLLIHTPTFLQADICQQNPQSSITITLSPDIDIRPASFISISGFKSLVDPSSNEASLLITSSSSIASLGTWDKANGLITLTVVTNTLVNRQPFTVEVGAGNPVPQLSPTMYIKTTVEQNPLDELPYNGEGVLDDMNITCSPPTTSSPCTTPTTSSATSTTPRTPPTTSSAASSPTETTQTTSTTLETLPQTVPSTSTTAATVLFEGSRLKCATVGWL